MSDAATCPLCDAPNECGMAKGEQTCWCFSATIPAELLATVPSAAQGTRCVCASCVRNYGGTAESYA